MRVARPVTLNPEQRRDLEQLSRARSLSARWVERARIVLRAADGLQDRQIAEQLDVTPEKAARWRNRFLDCGLTALQKDAPRPGSTLTIINTHVKHVIEKTTPEKPDNPSHCSTRPIAR